MIFVLLGAFMALPGSSCVFILKIGILPMQGSQTDGLSQDLESETLSFNH